MLTRKDGAQSHLMTRPLLSAALCRGWIFLPYANADLAGRQSIYCRNGPHHPSAGELIRIQHGYSWQAKSLGVTADALAQDETLSVVVY